jgi:hypothetical protein
VEPGRDDGGEPVGQERREVIRVHGHDSAPPWIAVDESP